MRNSAVDRSQIGAPDTSVATYHQAWEGYEPTPLQAAPVAAERLGVATVSVKNESSRFGMPAFKILGASWATHRALCAHLGIPRELAPTTASLLARLGGVPLTLVAATDGNHGRAVARMAKVLSLRAHILVPRGTAEARIKAIQGEGATVTVVQGGYDETVAASAALADDLHLVISDTSWPGYETVPGWVIDGYSTLTGEIHEQRAAQQLPPFSVIAVQIGVGAFASAVVRAFGDTTARIIGVEPTGADCVLASIEAGQMTTLPGEQESIMAGLNCGTPSPVAWPDLVAGIDDFVTVEDREAEEAMRVLAADGIVSGESGAAGLAGLLAFSAELGLRQDDRVLVISTEGATDPEACARITGSAATSTATGS